MNIVGVRFLIWATCLVTAATSHAQYRFFPHVINEDRTDSVRFEYKIGDFSTHAEFEINGVFYEMYDNGTNGDRIAGDRVFTIMLDPQDFIADMQEDDAFRPLGGAVHPFIGDDSYKFQEVFAQVRTAEMPDVPVARYGNDMQVSAHVINIRTTAQLTYQQIFQRLNANNISRETDFLTVVRLPSQTATHTYVSVRNDVSGLGLPIFNNTSDPSVPAQFKGVLTMPISSRFDGVNRSVVRSLARQWAPQLGSPYSSCGFWNVSDLARSIVGYDDDGMPQCHSENFQYAITKITGSDDHRLVWSPIDVKYFNNMELYLMGLKPASQVEPFRSFRDQEAVRNALRTIPTNYRGLVNTYTIANVVASVGARVPAFGDAPTDFTVYTVVLSPELLSREEMAYYDHMAKRGESADILHTRDGIVKEKGVSFNTATQDAGSLSWKIKNIQFPNKKVTRAVCDGELFEYNGVEYETAGTYHDIIRNNTGKDTLLELVLTWLPRSEYIYEDAFCEGDAYDFNGRMLDEAGTYIDTMINSVGCDSFVTLELIANPTHSKELNERLCGQAYYLFAGDTLRESGVYFDMQTNAFGCDSSTTLTLVIEPGVDGGEIRAIGGQEVYTVCIQDGLQDLFWFTTTNDTSDYVFVITNKNYRVIDIVVDPVYDFETSLPKTELVWGVAFSGTFLLNRGDDLFNTEISDSCYDISRNFITVHKQIQGAVCAFVNQPQFGQDIDFVIAPNPVLDMLNMNLHIPSESIPTKGAQFEIINTSGEVVHSSRVDLATGVNNWALDVSNFAPGVYVARVHGVSAVGRFVKL